MKYELRWWFPDHEQHLIEWMTSAKGKMVLNDRPAYQGKKQLALLRNCKQFRTAVDVGAHVGLWAFNLSRAFQQVIAFEPLPEHAACFKRNLEGCNNVTLIEEALGVSSGWVTIATEQGSSGNSHVVQGEDVLGQNYTRSQPIRVQRLDDHIGMETQVDAVKIDAEGFEMAVLEGAEETIARCKPTVIVEQKRDMSEKRFGFPPKGAVEWLKERGYVEAEEISGDHIMVFQ